MGRAIVIPLYDHTGSEEIEDLLRELGRLDLAMPPVVVSGYVLPCDETRQAADELRDRFEVLSGEGKLDPALDSAYRRGSLPGDRRTRVVDLVQRRRALWLGDV